MGNKPRTEATGKAGWQSFVYLAAVALVAFSCWAPAPKAGLWGISPRAFIAWFLLATVAQTALWVTAGILCDARGRSKNRRSGQRNEPRCLTQTAGSPVEG